MFRSPLPHAPLGLALIILVLGHALSAWGLESAASWSDERDVRRPQLILGIGRHSDWPTPRGVQISVSNGRAVRVVDRGSHVRITGRHSGTALIRAGLKQVEVFVLPAPQFSLFDRMQTALFGKRGLELRFEAGHPVVRGRLLRLDDWISLAEAVADSDPSYQFHARIEESLIPAAQVHFRRLLREAGLPDLHLTLNSDLKVTLPSEPEDLQKRVSQVLGPYGFEIAQSPSSLGLEPLVRVKILVAELRTKMMSRIGLQWPASVEGQLLPSFKVPADSMLNIGINALEENGLGRVLASPVLLCRSGKEAEFLAGGEFPIKIANFKHQDVIWKRYGVLLKIKPKADFSGRMSIGVTTEVSTIDSAQTVDGIPGLLTNRIETHFDLNGSKTIALSGLIKREWGDSTSGLPSLGSLPVLGPLFSSQDYRDNKTELVVFVTPEVMRPDSEGK